MGFISDLLTNISAFRIKVGEKLNWLNDNKANTNGNYPNMTVGNADNADEWDGQNYVELTTSGTIDSLMSYDPDNFIWRKASKGNTQNWLGIGTNPDFVKKDGSVAMTGPLTNGGLIPAYKLKTNQAGGKEFEITSAYVTSDSMTIRNVTDNHCVMHFDGYNNVGINTVNPQAKLHVNGNAIVADATANNHAVTLGQAAGLVADRVINYENAPLIGFIAGGVNNPPYFYHSSGVFVRLATESFVANNFALLSQVYTQSQALALFVGLNGVQTIADTKTFTSSPVVPNGTLAGHTVNLGQLLAYGYQNASQVAATVSNEIAALGFAPESFEYFHGSPTIDTDKYREVIANYSGTSISDIDVVNAQYGGVVLTVQAGDNQLNLSIYCLKDNSYVSGDEVLPGTANTYVFNDSLDAWVRRSRQMEF